MSEGGIPWEAIGGAAGVVALVFAIPPTVTALRDLINGSRRARQEILDAIPAPTPTRLIVAGQQDEQAEIDYILKNGVDASTLESSLEASPKAIYGAMRRLVKENKVQIFILQGIIDAGPDETSGAKFKMPIFFKGGMNPSLRADPKEADEIISSLRPKRRRISN